jgi:hypothetical protein
MTSPPTLFLSREAERLGSSRQLRKLRGRGALVRVATGVFTPVAEWEALTVDEQYRARVRAASLISGPHSQFSHDSAAAMWRLPSIGPWSRDVHELTQRAAGGTSRVGIRRHALGRDSHPALVDDVTVTSLTRTLIDVSCAGPFVRSVAMVEFGLRDKVDGRGASTKLELLGMMDALEPYRGLTRARKVVDFASPLSDSPGESFSRVQFLALGYPDPQQQVEFWDEEGFIGFVDFFWPELGLICEFDGRSKYGKQREYQRDLTLEQILMREKDREDRLRRVSRSFVRLDWAKVSDRRRLAAYLRPHGLVEQGRSTRLVREPISAS